MELNRLLWTIIDWVYPPRCVECGETGALICESCLSECVPITEPYCKKCGKPLDGLHDCALCKVTKFRFISCRAPFVYDGAVAAGVKALKYKQNLGMANVFADFIYSLYLKENWTADMVVPVPLSKERMSQRGFNQSEWIAKSFARKAGIPTKSGALQKVMNTIPQVGLTREERQKNLHKAFAAEPVYVRGKRIVLVDDVMTTGSTFNECAGTLLNAGAKAVMCLSVATASASHA